MLRTQFLRQVRFVSLYSIVTFALTIVAPFGVANGQTLAEDNTTQKRGNTFNPAIGVNFLGLFQNGSGLSDDRSAVPHNGFSLQEAEFQFQADVDAYLRAAATLAVVQEDASPAGGVEYAIEPEELYLETISIPNFTIRAGKAKLQLGKHNQLHTHAFPFIDRPLVNQEILGEEGLNESQVSVSALLPASWFSELTVQIFDLSNDEAFNAIKSGYMGGLLRLRNLWDLTDDSTLELGLSGAKGANEVDEVTYLWGADLTYKWRPAEGGKYRALIWTTEYLGADRQGYTDQVSGLSVRRNDGLATWLQYQFAQRWWAQARYEYLGLNRSEEIKYQIKQSVLIGFFPSEFSGLRLQFDRQTEEDIDDADHTISLQYNLSIGAHPAHNY